MNLKTISGLTESTDLNLQTLKGKLKLGESAADVKDVIFGQLLQNFIFKQPFIKSKVESGSVLTGTVLLEMFACQALGRN